MYPWRFTRNALNATFTWFGSERVEISKRQAACCHYSTLADAGVLLEHGKNFDDSKIALVLDRGHPAGALVWLTVCGFSLFSRSCVRLHI